MAHTKIEGTHDGSKSGEVITNGKAPQRKAPRERLQVSAPHKAGAQAASGQNCSYEATGNPACNKK